MPRGVYDRAAAKAKREQPVQETNFEESTVEETPVTAPKIKETKKDIVDDTVQGVIRPQDLRNWNEKNTLYVRNNSLNAITHDDQRGGELTLKHRGSGEDTAVLPLEVARHPGFQKIWRRGMVSVSDDPGMEHELSLMELRAEEMQKHKLAEVLGFMESNPAEKDIVASKCVHCGDNIFVPESQLKRSDIPPLCADHLEMAPIFTIERYQDAKTGEEKVRWINAVLQPVLKEKSFN